MLYYTKVGIGPPVVLLHPVGLDQSFWYDVQAILSGEFTVFSVDLSGHGQSPAAPSGYRLGGYAADVAGLLQTQAVDPAAVVGLSFGGMVAQHLALHYPAQVSCAVFCGCPCGFPDETRTMLAERGAAAERDGMAAIVESTLSRWFTRDFLAAGKADAVRRCLLEGEVHGWATAWRAIAALDTKLGLGRIRIPTLCIAGALDEAVIPATVRSMASAIPGSEYKELPGASHMMHIETPELFAETVVQFLDHKSFSSK
jgi:3-oxoadipate enol-lactonase